MSTSLPLPSEFIEVLWITDEEPFWWKALVLEIDVQKKGNRLAKASLRYEPGPKFQNESEYKVYFYSDQTIGERSRTGTNIRNTWRAVKEDEDSNDEYEWSHQNRSRNESSTRNEAKKRKKDVSIDEVSNDGLKEVIDDCISRISALEKWTGI